MTEVQASDKAEAVVTPRKARGERAEAVLAVKLVKMTRHPEGPAPHSADVHPDEVENYARGGWQVA